MKIRIKGDSIRFRLTKTEVTALCKHGSIKEETHFRGSTFTYAVARSSEEGMRAVYADDTITLTIQEKLLKGWDEDDRVGFEQVLQVDASVELHLLLEKDFVCLDQRAEDQSDHYPNPKLQPEQS